MSDVCIKRKIRNRLQDMGEKIFVQSEERCDDGFDSLRSRANGYAELKELSKGKKTDRFAFSKVACEKWMDVRTFGQVFAFGGSEVSVGVRGPVSIGIAKSASPVNIVNSQITKSVIGSPDSGKSDTMGTKYRVDFGLYKICGSMSCQMAERTGFSDEDAEKVKQALMTLFENDSSAARPEGSMEVRRVYWWVHDSKMPKHNTASVHRSVKITKKDGVKRPKTFEDYDIVLDELEGLNPEIIEL